MKIIYFFFLFMVVFSLEGKSFLKQINDSTERVKDVKIFYDSLETKANRHRVTKLLYDLMYSPAKDTLAIQNLSYEYYKAFQNKTIGQITIKSLDVFGPTFDDTSRLANNWIEKTANSLHSKSSLKVLQKNLWIREGQTLDPQLLMDNERLIRSLPYMKDVRFVIKPRPSNSNVVDILILAQDVFSIGFTGEISNSAKAEFGIYDKNIFGIGHEIGINVLGHSTLSPHVGIETYFSMNNAFHDFFNISTGYHNYYLRKGYYFSIDREFLRPQTVYAGGLTFVRDFKSDRININDVVESKIPLNYLFLDTWYGRRLKLGINKNDNRFQITLSGRMRYSKFYDRPSPDTNNKQYFANSTLFLGGLSFSRRLYVRDYLIYSYGITEDIPKGYLHELVVGYDVNEFGNRWYSHVFLSSGNLFVKKPFHLFSSLGVGSFWNHSSLEQGIIDFNMNYISPIFNVWKVRARQFIKLNYTFGINRFEIENLTLRNSNGIRGFYSKISNGQQRLTLNVENVFFQNRTILNFKTAFFSFIDIGLLGQTDQSIFKQDYYAGIGMGLRIRNENLLIKTIQFRITYYPNHPSDLSAVGFMVDAVSKKRFYSFQPRGPEPLRFE